jgi:DUF1680 family protein
MKHCDNKVIALLLDRREWLLGFTALALVHPLRGVASFPEAASPAYLLGGLLGERLEGNRRYLHAMLARYGAYMLQLYQQRNGKQKDPWDGEYAGKWLDAALRTATVLGDQALLDAAKRFSADFRKCQAPDGYMGIEPEPLRGKAEWDVWNQAYAIAGWLTEYEILHDARALQAAHRAAKWIVRRFGPTPGAAFFDSAHAGGCNVDVVAELATVVRLTGDAELTRFCQTALREFVIVKRMRETHQAPLMHALVLLRLLRGATLMAAFTQDKDEFVWIRAVWEDLRRKHEYPTGGFGFNEEIRATAPNDQPNGGRTHQETCTTVEWLLLNYDLYCATDEMKFVEAMEDSVFNALLGAQSIDGAHWMYYTPLRYRKEWETGPTRCCYFSGPRAIARLVEWQADLRDSAITLLLLADSEVWAEIAGRPVKLKITTNYPRSGIVEIAVDESRVAVDRVWALNVRVPSCTRLERLTINGSRVESSVVDGLVKLERAWRRGDRVEIELALPWRTIEMLGHGACVRRGVEVLSVEQPEGAAEDWLDSISLPVEIEGRRISDTSSYADPNSYAVKLLVNGVPQEVTMTPFARAGQNGVRYRTVFPKASAGSAVTQP